MSRADLERLVAVHGPTGVLVDTNLLLLYLVGLLDQRLIKRFKRTSSFTGSDYRWLASFLAAFKSVFTTPTVLAEVNSLANQLPERNKSQFYAVFREQIMLLDERYEPSRHLCAHCHFSLCGLTDTSIMSIAVGNRLVLTTDARLAVILARLGIDTINFNHLRSWLLE